METSVYILLLISLFYFRLRGKLFAMSLHRRRWHILCRPDALLLILPVWIELFLRLLQHGGLRVAVGKILLVSLPLVVIIAGWSAFALSFYGTILPHSLLAKSVAYRLDSKAGLIRLIQSYATPFFEEETFGTGIILITAPLYLFLSVMGILAAEKTGRGEGAAAGLAFPWIYFLTFSAANPLIFRWYLAPPMPFLFLSIFIGLAAVLRLVKSPEAGIDALARDPFRRDRARPACCSTLAIGLSGRIMVPRIRRRRWPTSVWNYCTARWRMICSTDCSPARRWPPGTSACSGIISTPEFWIRSGLNSAQSVRYYPLPESMYAIVYAMPPNLILDQQPEYVVLLEVYGRNGLLLDSRFLDQYRICAQYPTDIYGSRAMLVYCRKDLP